jgi:hypothetical protein
MGHQIIYMLDDQVRPYGSKTWHVISICQHISVAIQLSCSEQNAAIQLFPECITVTQWS